MLWIFGVNLIFNIHMLITKKRDILFLMENKHIKTKIHGFTIVEVIVVIVVIGIIAAFSFISHVEVSKSVD